MPERLSLRTRAARPLLLAVIVLTMMPSALSTQAPSTVQADLQAYFAAQVEPRYASATQFTFGVISDIHLHPAGWPFVFTRGDWQAQVQKWRDAGHLFGMVVGDLGYGDYADIADVTGGASAVPGGPPVYYVMGNHETDGPAGKRAWVDALYPGAVSPGSWTPTAGLAGNRDRAYWSFDVGPSWHFVALDATIVQEDGTLRTGTLDRAQLDWLAADLQANTDRKVMVFVHEPVDQAQYDTPYYTLNDRGRLLLDLLAAHPKQAFVFSGHLHGYRGITYWKGVTLVHTTYEDVSVRIDGETATVSWPGMGPGNIVQYEETPLYQVQSDGVTNTLRVGEEGANYGRTRDGRVMTVVSAQNGVTPTYGTLMLKAGPVTWYDKYFISEQLVKIVPGMTLSYDIYLQGTSPGLDAIAVQPDWMTADGAVPPRVTDQNGIALSTHTRDGGHELYYDGLQPLGGRASDTWYHREIDLTPLAGGFADGIHLVALAGSASASAVYVDNITFTWPADGVLPPAAVPTFNPPGGTYSSSQQVTIADATPGATIYYTTDGTTPTTASAVYTGPITVDTTTTLNAIAAAPDRRESDVGTAVYTFRAAAPTFSPPGGTYGSSQLVAIGSATPGAALYYTVDGTVPTMGSTPYTGPIPVDTPTTIRAIAAAPGWNPSTSAAAVYAFQAATPTFTPATGTYTAEPMVEIASATPGAAIHYTTDGTTPTTASAVYTSPIAITRTTTVKAIAALSGWVDSPVGSATYTMKVATPAFTPAAGTYTTTKSVTISTATPGASIHYTTNGATPTKTSPLYTGPIEITRTTTLKAIGVLTGWSNSSVRSGTFTLKVATPTFTPVAGTYNSPQSVAISTTAGATIHYTIDGSTPTTASPVYGGPIEITRTTTVKAMGVLTGWSNSSVRSGTFTLKVATPTLSPPGGTYVGAQSVTIAVATPGATIYYTTNGTTPTTASPVYTGPVAITASKTLKALAAVPGWSNSNVVTGIYTIQ